MLSRRLWSTGGALAVVTAAAFLLVGCSSSSKSASPTTLSTSATTAATPATTAAPSGGKQSITITPSSGLSSTQKVSISASGFSPNEALVVTQCADKGNNTGEGDCNTSGMQFVTSNASGGVSVQFTVVKGPFGTNHIVCGSAQPCLVSVTQATLSPTQEADARISFS